MCYKQHVRQFHNDPATNKLASEYLLGNYDPAGDQPAVQADSGIEGLSSTPSRYVAQRYTNGEACDVTDEPRLRSTEVRFVCAADGRDLLVGVTEPQTCQYVITVATKVLCRHEAFQVWQVVHVWVAATSNRRRSRSRCRLWCDVVQWTTWQRMMSCSSWRRLHWRTRRASRTLLSTTSCSSGFEPSSSQQRLLVCVSSLHLV